MAFRKKARGNPIDPQISVYEETITSVSGRAVYSGEYYPQTGCDFQVYCNVDSTNLSASTHVEYFVSDKTGGTFVRHPSKVWFNATTGAIDNISKVLFRNVSVSGQDSVVKFKIPSGGGSVKLRVIEGVKPITE